MQTSKLLLSALLFAGPALAQCLTIQNAQPGTNLNLGDDTGRVMTLPFPFPFNGQVYNEIAICSNGFVWIGPPPVTNPWDLSPSEAEMLSMPPRVAVCWNDWNPASTARPPGAGVYYLADAASVNIVWKDVPRFGSTTIFANMELVLTSSGAIFVHFASSMGIPNSASITGISAGIGASPNQVVWSSFPTIPNATGYELYGANVFPLVGTTILLSPTSPNSYASVDLTGSMATCPPLPSYPPLASATQFGQGCPNPTVGGSGTFYEFFTTGTVDLSNSSILFTYAGGNNYVAQAGPGFDSSYSPGDALVQGDDTQVTVSTAAMGGFPYMGQNRLSAAACSNGFLWMVANASNSFTATALAFAQEGPRIAPLWGDWNFNQGGTGQGGTFYWTATPGFCMATWENVAAFGVTGSQNTFQVKLLPNGDVIFSYGNVLNNSTTASGAALAGLSGGGSNQPTASYDLTTVQTIPAVFDLTPYTLQPLQHRALSMPALGGVYNLEASGIPTGTVLGAFVLSFTQYPQGIDLSSIGMPGCSQYVGLDTRIVVVVSGPTTTFGLTIPPVPAFGGIALASQAVMFTPGVTPLGVISSNGVLGTVGL